MPSPSSTCLNVLSASLRSLHLDKRNKTPIARGSRSWTWKEFLLTGVSAYLAHMKLPSIYFYTEIDRDNNIIPNAGVFPKKGGRGGRHHLNSTCILEF